MHLKRDFFRPSYGQFNVPAAPSEYRNLTDFETVKAVSYTHLTFVSARLVGLAVKLPSAFALVGRFLSGLREPLGASVTLSEATAPVKPPA